MDDSEGREVMEHQDEKELSVSILSKDVESGRPGRRTSKVWQVFARLDDNNAQCNLCNRVLSFKSSVTNLAKHIQRKHASTFLTLCADLDPREGLKEFITIETGHGQNATEDEIDDDAMRSDDTEWVPPTKSARKSASAASKKVIKKEVISSNGVDYVIYTQDQVATRPTPSSTTKRTPVTPKRSVVNSGRSPVVYDTPVLSTCGQSTRPQVEEDEFSTFAKFLSQRIRSLKNPYWQSCAINEINSALYRIEMRRYDMPKADCAQRFAQTEPSDPLEVRSDTIISDPTSINESHQVVEVHAGDVM